MRAKVGAEERIDPGHSCLVPRSNKRPSFIDVSALAPQASITSRRRSPRSTVGAALVGVVQQAGLRAPPLQRHLQRAHRQMAIIHRAHRPADDEAGVRGRRIAARYNLALLPITNSVVSPTRSLIGALGGQTAAQARWRRPADRARSWWWNESACVPGPAGLLHASAVRRASH